MNVIAAPGLTSAPRRSAHVLPVWFKPLVWLLALLPFGLMLAGLFNGGLGANPVEEITHITGETAIRLLLFTLAVTPLRRLTGWQALARVRRLLGLFAFFYALLHFGTYALLDASLDVAYITEDIVKRPYITIGFTAFVLLVPLAATSTRGIQRRLGGRRWALLHKLAYAATTGGIVHLLWQVKVISAAEIAYALTLALLLALRLPFIASRLPQLRSALSAR